MKKVFAILAIICSFGLAVVAPTSTMVFAESVTVGGESYDYDPNYDPNGKILPTPGNGENEAKDRAKTIVTVLATAVGVVSVVMIIWGGIMYSYSAGDPSKAQLAKRIIVSAIIGLVLSILAGVILNVVVTVAEGGTI